MLYPIVMAILIFCCMMVIAIFTSCLMGRDSGKKLFFMLLTWAIFLYVLGYVLEILSASPGEALTATRVKYVGAPFVGPFFLLFIADYCNFKVRRPKIIIPLLIIPAVNCILALSGEGHRLFYQRLDFIVDRGVPLMAITAGPFYNLHQILNLICIVAGLAILASQCRHWNRHRRQVAKLIFLASLTPQAANFLHWLGIHPYGVNGAPLALALTLLVGWVALKYYGILDNVPKAEELALRSIPDGLIILDRDGGFVSANQAAVKIFPQLENLTPWRKPKAGDWPPELAAWLDSPPGSRPGRLLVKPLDGGLGDQRPRHYEIRGQAVPALAGTSGWLVMLHEVTEMVALMERLEEEASTDHLTGLFNRRHFQIQAEREFLRVRREGGRLAVIMMDLDHFKKVNDQYGHLAGDEVLSGVAGRISQIMRPYDWLARYGGEEFMALTIGLWEDGVGSLARRIGEAVAARPFPAQGRELPITISLGVAFLTPEVGSLDGVIHRADLALYQAKVRGRDRVEIFDGV